ncbi:MAG: hypothetical protein WEB30_16390 [Cyclobacteriaceae bacterium]
MKLCSKVRWLIFLPLFSACSVDEDNKNLLIFSKDYDFNDSDHGWKPGFADYPAGPDSALFELKYGYTEQVGILTKRSVMLQGKNLNRDLFMYLKKKVDGLEPNKEYTVTFSVELASNCSSFTTDAQGSVYLKVGAVNTEPFSLVESGNYVINIDKGNEGTVGRDVILLGDIISGDKNSGLVLLTRNNTMANSRYVARTNANGELWLIIGTDSNLEGITTLFYTRVNIVFSAS